MIYIIYIMKYEYLDKLIEIKEMHYNITNNCFMLSHLTYVNKILFF